MSANRCPNPSCEFFNRVLPTNAKVCPMCGTTIGNAIPPVPQTPTPISQPIVPPPPYPQPTPSPQIPLFKLIHSSQREFNLFGESGYIGRRNSSTPEIPEIDLTGIPNEDIISRRHALVTWDRSANAYTIVDMSTNGIYLNGKLLTPNAQYQLNNGDSLQLGQENLINFKVSIG